MTITMFAGYSDGFSKIQRAVARELKQSSVLCPFLPDHIRLNTCAIIVIEYPQPLPGAMLEHTVNDIRLSSSSVEIVLVGNRGAIESELSAEAQMKVTAIVSEREALDTIVAMARALPGASL